MRVELDVQETCETGHPPGIGRLQQVGRPGINDKSVRDKVFGMAKAPKEDRAHQRSRKDVA